MKFTRILLSAALATLVTSAVVNAAPKEVRVASHVSEFSPLHAQSQLFAAAIEKRLPGQFTFKLFPGGQLGKEKALIANVQAGSLEMINVASGVMKLDKKLGVFDLPWLFSDRDHVKRAMKGGLEDAIRTRIEEVGSVKVIGVYENGFRHVINSQRAVGAPGDLDCLKIRISGGKFRQGVFQNMGATPPEGLLGRNFHGTAERCRGRGRGRNLWVLRAETLRSRKAPVVDQPCVHALVPARLQSLF